MVYLQFAGTESIKMKSQISNNYLQTQKIAEDFAKTLKGGEIVCLYGDLGAGKTTFTQGLARGLGVKNRIISPTFIIVRKYNIKNSNLSQNVKVFYHIDLYRVEDEKELDNLGMDEILADKNAVVVIEWAEKLGKKMPEKRVDIYLDNLDDNERQIVWK